MPKLHLEILTGRLKREFSIEINQGKPQVVYRETITAPSIQEEIFQRELSGQQHFAGVQVEISPLKRGSGNKFVNQCKAEGLTEEFLEAIRQGTHEAEGGGSLMGYPVIEVKTTLLNVQVKETSDAMAFRVAANMAFKQAFLKAEPILLEPIMKTEVLVPEAFTGDVIGDLNARKGKISQIVSKGSTQVLTANVPLSKMFGYSTALRSASQGRGTFSMQFSHYDQS